MRRISEYQVQNIRISLAVTSVPLPRAPPAVFALAQIHRQIGDEAYQTRFNLPQLMLGPPNAVQSSNRCTFVRQRKCILKLSSLRGVTSRLSPKSRKIFQFEPLQAEIRVSEHTCEIRELEPSRECRAIATASLALTSSTTVTVTPPSLRFSSKLGSQ